MFRRGTWKGRVRSVALPLIVVALGAGPSAGTEAVSPSLRIRIGNEAHAARVRAAVRGAGRRLAEPRCQRILSEFTDTAGRTLRQNLDELGASAAGYLALMSFDDGAADRPCRRSDVLAFTTPGDRAIRLCTPRFATAQDIDPDLAEVVIIHEALHSLGLGENPPSSEEINWRVGVRCGR